MADESFLLVSNPVQFVVVCTMWTWACGSGSLSICSARNFDPDRKGSGN